MNTRRLILAMSLLTAIPVLGGCKSDAEKLEEKLKAEMPTDCRPYCGTASCGGECTSAESLETAKTVLKSHCAEIKNIGTKARLQQTGNLQSNRYLDTSTCDFKDTP